MKMAKLEIRDIDFCKKANDKELKMIKGGVIGDCGMPLPRLHVRNEGDKIKGFFQGWQEKANQVDQQLTSILRIMKDLGRVGVGGSDLGAS
jgi:hypothetical protein